MESNAAIEGGRCRHSLESGPNSRPASPTGLALSPYGVSTGEATRCETDGVSTGATVSPHFCWHLGEVRSDNQWIAPDTLDAATPPRCYPEWTDSTHPRSRPQDHQRWYHHR